MREYWEMEHRDRAAQVMSLISSKDWKWLRDIYGIYLIIVLPKSQAVSNFKSDFRVPLSLQRRIRL